jgi:hypothetical protein
MAPLLLNDVELTAHARKPAMQITRSKPTHVAKRPDRQPHPHTVRHVLNSVKHVLKQNRLGSPETTHGQNRWHISTLLTCAFGTARASLIQARSTAAVVAVSGVTRCFRPLPRQLRGGRQIVEQKRYEHLSQIYSLGFG